MAQQKESWIASSQGLPCANALRLSQAMTAEKHRESLLTLARF
jgi:hypothetical protein